jgi:hypothetical protein
VIVVIALELRQIDLINESTSNSSEYRARLLMDAANDDGLLHALESHSKQEQSCNLQVAREVHKDLA